MLEKPLIVFVGGCNVPLANTVSRPFTEADQVLVQWESSLICFNPSIGIESPRIGEDFRVCLDDES